MNFKDLADRLDHADWSGENARISALSHPGEGDKDTAEIWFEGPVRSSAPVIVDEDTQVEDAPSVLRLPDLSRQLRFLLAEFEAPRDSWGIHDSAHVEEDFFYQSPISIAPGVYVGPGVTVGERVRLGPGVSLASDVTLGDGVELRAGVRIECPCIIGDGTLIHANTVVGADGYGFQQEEGIHEKVPQIGRVKIGRNVEIGALSTVDRATFGKTTIGDGTKIDNHVQIAHNCRVGKHCLLVAYSGLSGSVRLGDHVTMGAQAGVAPHVEVADRVRIAGGAGVTKDITEEGLDVSGTPAMPHRQQLKQDVLVRRLPDLRERLQRMEEQIQALTKENS